MDAAPLARADLHVHTRYSRWRHLRFIHPRDSYSEPLDLYRTALGRGMDFVAITDHDTLEGALRLLENPEVDPSRVVVGEELECRFPETGQWLHLNLFGLTEGDHRDLQGVSGDVRAAVALCRERGILCVLNHPFQSWRGQKPLEAYAEDLLELFTHVEGLNGGVPALQNRAAGRLARAGAARGRPLVQVGGSDAHTLRRVARAWTEAPGTTAAEFMASVREGRCRPGGRATSTPGLLWDGHAVVATYYGRLYTGRGEAPSAAAYALDVAFATASLAAIAAGLPSAIILGNQVRQKAVAAVAGAKLARLAAPPPEPYTASLP